MNDEVTKTPVDSDLPEFLKRKAKEQEGQKQGQQEAPAKKDN
jgi:hypothetical protein